MKAIGKRIRKPKEAMMEERREERNKGRRKGGRKGGYRAKEGHREASKRGF